MKKSGCKINLLMLLGLVIVFLSGCVFLKDKEDNDTSHKSYDYDESAEEMYYGLLCDDIVAKVKGVTSWEEKLNEEEKEAVQYYNIAEDGTGIMIIYLYDGGMLSYRGYVYYSEDYGNTWKKQNEDAHVFKREGDIFSVNKHIIVSTLEGSNMAGFWTNVYVSHDAGATFNEVDIYAAIGGIDMLDFYTKFKVKKMDYINERVVLSWIPYNGEWEEPFLTAEYDMNLYCTKILHRNDVFYEVYGKLFGGQFVFPESDKAFLTEDKIKEYRYACLMLDDCTYYDTFEELLNRGINELYARKGYDFTDTDYDYIYNQYQGEFCEEIYTDVEQVASRFNEYEQANVDILASFRNELKE